MWAKREDWPPAAASMILATSISRPGTAPGSLSSINVTGIPLPSYHPARAAGFYDGADYNGIKIFNGVKIIARITIYYVSSDNLHGVSVPT